jgi:hypothetical protein
MLQLHVKFSRRCVFDNCNKPNVSLHGFPTNAELRQHWIDFVRKNGKADFIPNSLSRICSAHFRLTDFVNYQQFKCGFAKNLVLHQNTIPSIIAAASSHCDNSANSIIDTCQQTTCQQTTSSFVGIVFYIGVRHTCTSRQISLTWFCLYFHELLFICVTSRRYYHNAVHQSEYGLLLNNIYNQYIFYSIVKNFNKGVLV